MDIEWRAVVGFEGYYEVSNTGVVRNAKTGLERKPWLHKGKWLRITLHKDGKQKNARVHRMVAGAFLENPKNKSEVNHLDCDQENNCVWNLEWCTGEENREHYKNYVIT